MTKQEREQYKQLVMEAKDLESKQQSEEYIPGQGSSRRYENCQNKEKILDPVPAVTREISELTSLSTNTDCLMNKRSELENLIACNRYKPDITGVKSCKQKHRPLISELAIQGYDSNQTNMDEVTGRSVILYTATWLKASPYTPKHACQESAQVDYWLYLQKPIIFNHK